MSWGWVIAIGGGLFLLSQRGQSNIAQVGGMSPTVPAGGAVPAVNSTTGQTIMVTNPLPTNVQSPMPNATTFAIDPSDESFVGIPFDPAQIRLPATAGVMPISQPAQQVLAPGISIPVGSVDGIVPQLAAPGSPASITASPSPFLIAQIPGMGDVPTGNTTSQWDATGTVLTYYMQYKRPDGSTYNVPFDPFSGGIQEAPPQASTTALGALANASPAVNPLTGRVSMGAADV